jgi:hypothetical protein
MMQLVISIDGTSTPQLLQALAEVRERILQGEQEGRYMDDKRSHNFSIKTPPPETQNVTQ